jgi:hypothetical protein
VRAARIALVLACTTGSLTVGSDAVARHVPEVCRLHRHTGETIRHFSGRQISCAVDVFGPVRGGVERAVCIAKRESGLLPDAQSLTGQYLGLYQHAAVYWDWRYDTYTKPAWDLPTSALKGRTNAVVTIRMVAAAGSWKDAGWPRGDC